MKLPVNVKHFLNIIISGAAVGILNVVGTGLIGIHVSFKQLGIAALSGAIVATVRHFQNSPVFKEE